MVDGHGWWLQPLLGVFMIRACRDEDDGEKLGPESDTSEASDAGGSVTILIPCCNEAESCPLLFERLDRLVAEQAGDVVLRVLFVDDGSRDDTREFIRTYVSAHAYARYIFLSRNFGKENAMLAGIDAVDTDAVVIIDADLQDPPELIPQMIELWRIGYHDVYARRRSRKGESWLKRTTSRWYYRLLQKFTKVPIQQDTGDFRLLDRKCIDALRQLREHERNSKALFSWVGFRKIEILYDRDERAAGTTHWRYGQLFKLALDGITSFTTAPLRFASLAGIVIALLTIVYAICTLVKTIIFGVEVPGYASLLMFMLMLGSVELICLGIIGEYLGRVFMETKRRPNYLVEEDSRTAVSDERRNARPGDAGRRRAGDGLHGRVQDFVGYGL